MIDYESFLIHSDYCSLDSDWLFILLLWSLEPCSLTKGLEGVYDFGFTVYA